MDPWLPCRGARLIESPSLPYSQVHYCRLSGRSWYLFAVDSGWLQIVCFLQLRWVHMQGFLRLSILVGVKCPGRSRVLLVALDTLFRWGGKISASHQQFQCSFWCSQGIQLFLVLVWLEQEVVGYANLNNEDFSNLSSTYPKSCINAESTISEIRGAFCCRATPRFMMQEGLPSPSLRC